MKSAIGYICVIYDSSTEHYNDETERQKNVISDYASKNGYLITDWFTDNIRSGRQVDRTQLDSLLYEAESNPTVKAVIVAERDVLSSDKMIYAYYAFRFEELSMTLLNASADPAHSNDKIPDEYRIFARFVAEEERKRTNWNTRRSREAKAKRGAYSGGRPPFGYRVENHSLVLVPSQAEIVRKIFQMREAEKRFYYDIAEELNKQGYFNSKDLPWSVGAIQAICENKKRYQGYWRYSKTGEWVKGEHEPILSEE